MALCMHVICDGSELYISVNPDAMHAYETMNVFQFLNLIRLSWIRMPLTKNVKFLYQFSVFNAKDFGLVLNGF